MHLARIANSTLLILAAGLLVSAARGQYRPEVPVLKCVHVGEAVPGVPGATFIDVWPPHIDGAGNVLATAWIAGPGIIPETSGTLWFGQPGALVLVARNGQQAPNLPLGVVYADVTPGCIVSETGWIAFTAFLSGPGVVEDLNDAGIFCGPPGDFQLIKRTGDPVPEVGPGVTIAGEDWIGAAISDNGTLFVGAGLTGPGIHPAYHRAEWSGPRGELQLAFWEGMPVPGCPDCQPGVKLLWADSTSCNDFGQVAFRGMMTGPGIYSNNDTARWIGPAGGLEIMHREGQPMPEFGPGVYLRSATGILNAINQYPDWANVLRLQGPGITTGNDWVLVAGAPEPCIPLAREGDPTPEAQSGCYLEYVSNHEFLNNRREILRFAGFGNTTPGSGVYSGFGLYFGPYASQRLIMESGRPAPYFGPGQVFRKVNYAGEVALNDVGDIVTYSQAGPPTGSDGLTDVLWLWHHAVEHWTPILWSGMQVDGRTVTADQWGILAYYDGATGGADGQYQGFNDQRQMVVWTQFTDGTRGIYRLGPPLLGDTDGDGQVGVPELVSYASCAAVPGTPVELGCAALDLNLNGTVDLEDFAPLQAMVGEPR